MHRQFCSKFGRSDITVDHLKALCSRRGWKTGRTGYFPSGHVPANKGKKMPFNPASARTQFKKGVIPPNRKYIGHERTDKDGYVWISVAETNPHTGHARRYVMKHRWLWEKQHGPIPADMVLKCLDSDKSNTDPSNWTLISRAMLPRLAGRWSVAYDDAPPELKPLILNTARLEQKVKAAT